MISLEFIEAVLIEQDLEGLIDMGAPKNEYEHEAELIYSRLTNEKIENCHSCLIKIALVFQETFGSGISYNGIEKTYHYDQFYLKREYDTGMSVKNRLKDLEIVAKLIWDKLNEKEET